MARCYLDANVLVYFVDRKSVGHKKSVAVIEKLIVNDFKLVVSALVLDEFLQAIRRKMIIKYKRVHFVKLREELGKVVSLPGMEMVVGSDRVKWHLGVVEYMKEFKLKPRDAYHLMICLENKVGYFATFDSDFDGVFRKGLVRQFGVER